MLQAAAADCFQSFATNSGARDKYQLKKDHPVKIKASAGSRTVSITTGFGSTPTAVALPSSPASAPASIQAHKAAKVIPARTALIPKQARSVAPAPNAGRSSVA